MDEVFCEVDRAQLRPLCTRRDGPALRRAAAQLLLLAGSAAVLATCSPTAASLPFALAFATQTLLQVAMFGLLHESVHGTAFATRAANRAAAWCAAVWQFAPPAWMRAFHFAHHRHTHELATDPELSNLPWMARWPRGAMWLLTMSGLLILFARAGITLAAATGARAVYAKLPYIAAGERAAVTRDARLLVLIHALLIGVALTVLPGLGWCYLAALPAHALLSAYLTCEHRGLPLTGDVLQRTRSLRTSALWRWLLWNMPFHAEHHACPGVPFHALPQLHEVLRERLPRGTESLWRVHRRDGA